MSDTQKMLWKGALKSAVSAATGLIMGLPVADPEHFNPMTFGGWGHLGIAIGFVILANEARYWNQWANSSNGGNK